MVRVNSEKWKKISKMFKMFSKKGRIITVDNLNNVAPIDIFWEYKQWRKRKKK